MRSAVIVPLKEAAAPLPRGRAAKERLPMPQLSS